MTFSVIARCKRTDMFGIAIATRPLAIGAKCPFLKAGIGGLVSQANGDPRFGPLGLNLLELGYSAPKVMREIEDNDPYIEWRQIAVIDSRRKNGRSHRQRQRGPQGAYCDREFCFSRQPRDERSHNQQNG